jgi:hypothetical protein
MRLTILLILFSINAFSFAAPAKTIGIDPDLIDPEMTKVMYLIGPNDIRTTAYNGGHPSDFELKLCATCQLKSYRLKSGAKLELNGSPLEIKDLTISLIKKSFETVQLGIDRPTKTISYLYLGAISEPGTGESE